MTKEKASFKEDLSLKLFRNGKLIAEVKSKRKKSLLRKILTWLVNLF